MLGFVRTHKETKLAEQITFLVKMKVFLEEILVANSLPLKITTKTLLQLKRNSVNVQKHFCKTN